MKKAVTVIISAVILAAALVGIYKFKKNIKKPDTTCRLISRQSITKIHDLSELKSKADLIAEVTGTDKHKIINYKGIKSRILEVKVNEVFKGSNDLQKINIIQVEKLDVPPENGQRLLMFLRKDRENMSDNPYAVVGAGQGIYILAASNDAKGRSSLTLKPQALKNDKILQELSGSYDQVKRKLK